MKRSKNFYLYRLYQLIASKKTPEQIQKDLNFSKQNLYYYRKDLKKLEYIEQISYGVWKTVKKYDEKEVLEYLEEVKKTTKIAMSHLEEVKNIKEIRGHAFQVKLELPEDYKNWNNREKIFNMINLEFKDLKVGGIKRGQQALINNIKVHFYNKSIVVNLSEDYLHKTSKESKYYMLVDFLKIIKKLERMFNGSPLSHYGKYKFRVTRQHYAIIKNALAKQYLNEKKKLEVYTGRGLWLLIDNSFNLEELETVHPETAQEDNEKVHEHFNIIKKEDVEVIREMTPSNIKKEIASLNGVFPAMQEYNENLKLHIVVQKEQLKTQGKIQRVLELMEKKLK